MSHASAQSHLDLADAPPGPPLTEAQRGIATEVRARLRRGDSIDAVLDFMVDSLKREFPHHAWSGVYLRSGSMLTLGPFRGPDSPHHRIRIGEEGICGWVALHGRPQVIPDVSADPRYLMCSSAIRSEIVVPIARDGAVVGVIDVDSETLSAFTRSDLDALTELAEAVAPAVPVASAFPAASAKVAR